MRVSRNSSASGISCQPKRGTPMSTEIVPSACSSALRTPATVSKVKRFFPVSAASAWTTQRMPLPQAWAAEPSELRMEMKFCVPGVRGSWIAMIWSNLVTGSALSAIAAWGVTRSARPRMSATMISLPRPFIRAKGTRWFMRRYMAETTANYQCRWLRCGQRPSRSGNGDDAEQHQQEKDQHDGDQDFGAGERRAGDRIEAEKTGNCCDDEQDEYPFDHDWPASRVKRC